MTIQFEIKDAIINDQLCTALEGGSNYWYYLGDIDRKHFIKGETLVDNLTRSFLTDKKYKLPVYDIESAEEFEDMDKLGDVTYRDMEWALSEMALLFSPENLDHSNVSRMMLKKLPKVMNAV